MLFFLIIFKCAYSVFALYIQCFCAVHLQCHFIEPLCLFFFLFSFFFLFNKFWIVAIVPSWFNKLCWGKIHYSTYNFFGLSFCIFFSLGCLFLYFFSLHTILSKNTWFFTQKQKQKLRKKTFFIPYVWGSLQFFLKL